MLILHFFSHSYKLMLFFPFSYMIFLINSSYNADEKEKAPAGILPVGLEST